jgi:hypothetical protein
MTMATGASIDKPPFTFGNGMYTTHDYQEHIRPHHNFEYQLGQAFFGIEDELFRDDAEPPFAIARTETELTIEGILRASIALGASERLHLSQAGFDAVHRLGTLQGQFIEVGGPSYRPYQILGGLHLPRPLTTYNIDPSHAVHYYKHTHDSTSNTDHELLATKGVDVKADAHELQVRAGSIGALFVSFMVKKTASRDTRLATMQEAGKAMQQAGLLIWRGGNEYGDLMRAKMAGLRLAAILLSATGGLHECIFEKPEE